MSISEDFSSINSLYSSHSINMAVLKPNPCSSNENTPLLLQRIEKINSIEDASPNEDFEVMLIWEGISYKSKNWFTKSKPILQNLSGILHSNTLLAIVGPSGGGKSTFLKCLSFGNRLNGFSGKITANNDSKTCYITQNAASHLFLNLRVREALNYAARLRNINDNGVDGIVNHILEIMELRKVQDTLICDCSGGQQKRIAIGQEITPVKKPRIILLDEPTSGLDSNMSLKLIKILKNLTDQEGISIITVIHQSSEEMFNIFDEIYTITNKGELFYNGKPGMFREWYMQQSRNNEPMWNKNPADDIIDKAIEWNDGSKYQFESSLSSVIQNINNQKLRLNGNLKIKGLCAPSLKFNTRSFRILCKRSANDKYCKAKLLIFGRIFMNAVVILILRMLYSNNLGQAAGCSTEKSTEDEITQNIGFQFFIILFLMFASMMPNVLSFPKEMDMFFNEHTNGSYSTSNYYFSKIVVELPFQIILPFIYCWLLYLFTNQVDMDHWGYGFLIFRNFRFNYYFLFFGITAIISQGMAFAIGILFIHNFVPTVFISVVLMVLLFIFSGFFIKVSIMGSVGRFLTYASFVRFTFEGILVTLYGYDRCVDPPSTVMIIFDLQNNDVTFNFIMLCVNMFVWYSLGYIVLIIRVNRCINNKLKDVTRIIYKNTLEKISQYIFGSELLMTNHQNYQSI